LKRIRRYYKIIAVAAEYPAGVLANRREQRHAGPFSLKQRDGV
jgi:hypothetical protein